MSEDEESYFQSDQPPKEPGESPVSDETMPAVPGWFKPNLTALPGLSPLLANQSRMAYDARLETVDGKRVVRLLFDYAGSYLGSSSELNDKLFAGEPPQRYVEQILKDELPKHLSELRKLAERASEINLNDHPSEGPQASAAVTAADFIDRFEEINGPIRTLLMQGLEHGNLYVLHHLLLQRIKDLEKTRREALNKGEQFVRGSEQRVDFEQFKRELLANQQSAHKLDSAICFFVDTYAAGEFFGAVRRFLINFQNHHGEEPVPNLQQVLESLPEDIHPTRDKVLTRHI